MTSYPPLLGDKDRHYRVHIVGNSGTGKSTIATTLAKTLGVPYLSLDELFWQPGWKQTPEDELKAKITAVLETHKYGWVIDGNFEWSIGPIVQASATDVIWLDPPFVLYFPRLVLRTLRRLVGTEPPCSPGCSETFSNVFFSRSSIFLWCISFHFVARRINGEKMKRIGLGVGSDVSEQKMRRFGGWGSALRRWMQDVVDMMASRRKVD
ncbi:AAA domain-containing protein [Cyathus striatus]|nr:AAA domain-containing protein [Cyathus striatus]